MRHKVDGSESDLSEGATKTARVRRTVSKLASYVLVAVAIAAFYAFFAPHVGVPQLPVDESLPSMVAPTEGKAVVDVFPAIVGALAAAAAVYVR